MTARARRAPPSPRRYAYGEPFEQTLKIANTSATMFLTFGQGFSLAKYLNLFLDRVNHMYIYIFSVLFDTGGVFLPHTYKFLLN
jgi:hypothetical protein